MCLCRAHYLLLAVIVVLGLASMLNACGAKGDLYLPEASPQQPAPETSQPPAASPGQPTP